MTGISFIMPTAGTDDANLNSIIDTIDALRIPNYEVIVVGGLTTTLNRNHTQHIPFDEAAHPRPITSIKKMMGVRASQYDINVIFHDYHVFDPDWYEEFEKFGTDWNICVQQTFSLPEQGSVRCNGWRAGPIPGYPEILPNMTIPWDIDCFIPYMAIQGSYWVAKRQTMIDFPINESLYSGQEEDIEWSSRIVPGWLGQKPDQTGVKIVSNPHCITRFNKFKPPYPGNPDFAAMERSLEYLWGKLRNGYRRAGVYHYERELGRVVLA
jgi:hypothetical protein